MTDILTKSDHFWPFLAPLSPLEVWKIKIFKKRKTFLEILPFYISVPKIIIIWCTTMELWLVTEGRKKWHRGEVPHLKSYLDFCMLKKRSTLNSLETFRGLDQIQFASKLGMMEILCYCHLRNWTSYSSEILTFLYQTFNLGRKIK